LPAEIIIMARKKRPLPFLENVEIIDAGAEGKAVARVNEKVLFVPFAAPGDVVDVQVYKKKRHFLEGRITELKKASPTLDSVVVANGNIWTTLIKSYSNRSR